MATILTAILFLSGAALVACEESQWSENYNVVNDKGTNLISCYECNVWKAGYGQLCDNPRIRTGCYACTKFETVIFMGYYKNTPRHSTVVSRACANSKSVPFHHECQYVSMGDGHSRRCYCTTPFCNSAERSTTTFTLPMLVLSTALLFALRSFHL